MGVPQKKAPTILRGLEPDGLAERTPHGWRLTEEAERAYGCALRAFQEWLDEVQGNAP
jgi:hypothetical protein